jgi:V-type H+-transporting ATPase subunit a
VFILFFQGDQLRLRVKKICDGFRATLYDCPPTAAKRREVALAIIGRIDDLNMVLGQTQEHSLARLQEVAHQIDGWKQKVVKIKSIFHTMNKFNLDVTAKCLIAECWYPVEYSEEVQQALMRGTERSGSSVPSILHRIQTDEAPPTYNKTNKVTVGFQAIVDAYGISNYREVNPAPYAVISFPFLFAVMFGDAGHGFIMALFAFLLILREKKLANNKIGGELFSIIFNGRYIIFLMGLFSIYTGLIYNDVFSKSLNIFGSQWNVSYAGRIDQRFVETGDGDITSTLLPTEAFRRNSPYPFGIDPIWQVATNKLLYINSYKMKLAIILGVAQMTFGIVLSIMNYLHFKTYIRIFSDFIPQLVFLITLFGYMVFLIMVKWITHWDNTSRAPSILITMINMFLGFGSKPDDYPAKPNTTNPIYPLYGGDIGTYQSAIQAMLVVLCFMCVPAMLCIRPVYLFIKHKRSRKREYSPQAFEKDDDDAPLDPTNTEEDKETSKKSSEPFSLMEIIILQSIHTIEFCLSCISHTASYLRLWALSLAHAGLYFPLALP